MDTTFFFGLMLVGVFGVCAAQPKYCCTPDQWEGPLNSFAVTGTMGEIEMRADHLYYDYTNTRAALFSNSSNSFGETTSVEVLWLYGPSNGTVYTLDLKTRVCKVQKDSKPLQKYCVSDSAQKLADVTLGAANDALPVSTYLDSRASGLQTTYVFTKQLCIPVSQLMILNKEPDLYLKTTGYANIKLGISQTSVFNVPPECKDAKLVFTSERQGASVTPFMFPLGRYFP